MYYYPEFFVLFLGQQPSTPLCDAERKDMMKPSHCFAIVCFLYLISMLFSACSTDGKTAGEKDAQADDSDSSGPDSGQNTDSDTETTDSEQHVIDTDGTCAGDASPCDELTDILCYVQLGCTSNSHCAGSARKCETIVILDNCLKQRNCTFDGSCTGNATPCSMLMSEASCNSQGGCGWSISGQRCDGKPFSCYQLGPESCLRQRGCSLSGTCKGVALDCDAISTANCRKQLGCRVEQECLGDSVPCGGILDYWKCEDQRGCDWD